MEQRCLAGGGDQSVAGERELLSASGEISSHPDIARPLVGRSGRSPIQSSQRWHHPKVERSRHATLCASIRHTICPPRVQRKANCRSSSRCDFAKLAAVSYQGDGGHPLHEAGLFSTMRARASVRESIGIPGTTAPERLLIARLFGSLDFEVLPGRGFDIGDTWYRGTPMSWFSPVADSRALPSPTGAEWLTRFTGGLLTTCGFGNIGGPAAGEGMHGNASHLPADQVSWAVTEDGGVRLEATVESVALFGPSFRVRRRIVAAPGDGSTSRLTIMDDVTNIGPQSAPLHLLYHLNFGAPLVTPGSSVIINSERVSASGPHPEVPDWRSLPQPADNITEAVFEHHGIHTDPRGFAKAIIVSAEDDIGVVVEWHTETLPRLYQWVFPTRGRWALAVEPATSSLFDLDRDRDDSYAGAPIIAPGESRSHEIRISFGTRKQALA